jgi:hypothetical protein
MREVHAVYREWSSRVSWHLKVLVRNLTLDVGSNQATEQPPFVGANFVPKAVRGEFPKPLFATLARLGNAGVQMAPSFALT